jgi:twitching motility protein PilT
MNFDQLRDLLTVGVKNGASDIHFRPGDAPIYRVNGVLHSLGDKKLAVEHTQAVAQVIMRRDDLDEVHEWDGSFSVAGVARFRVNVYRQRGSLAVVMRIIPARVPTIDALALPPAIKTIAGTDRGLVLVTGATGMGKTSTLAAMVDHVNKSSRKHIITIEDPIEYLHKNDQSSISQREIGTDTTDFKTALRSALRQDPDVILVGEMRDVETIDIAIKAAETGHLVFSTVHTVDAASTVSRLISVFPSEQQMGVRLRLADALKASISQRLLPRADGRGRVLAQEIMMSTANVVAHIRDPELTSSLTGVLVKNRENGMQSFDQHIAELLKAGQVTRDAALAAASNPTDFERAPNFGATTSLE